MKQQYQVTINETTMIEAENIQSAVVRAKKFEAAKQAAVGDSMTVAASNGSEFERATFIKDPAGRWVHIRP